MKTTSEIRSVFLDFFKKNKHSIIRSGPLVPSNDPSLMFAVAGMIQFKDMFLDKEKRDYTTAASSQKCVRAGGKHNDLDNIGHTKRHLTFFEMLGNYSFGDYFKEDAIKYAWDFLTKELGLNKDKIYITTYHTDQEAFDLWKKIAGFEDKRIIKIKTGDNFWSMGNTGPCGPCTEIFYDHGSRFSGGLPGSKDEDGGRYVEVWNLVFMEYERLAQGNLINLEKKSIDTGMGLERISAIIQGVYDNFEIDIFKAIISVIEDITSIKSQNNPAHRVVADHLRSSAFLIADGVMPSNEGRGYVLRRIIRRAIRHVNHLGYKELLMHKLLPILVGEMGEAYPELIKNEQFISDILCQEEEMFRLTLGRGLKLLNAEVKGLKSSSTLPGDVAFKLHDTYGFPVDLTQDILRDKNLKVDVENFDKLMLKQKDRARKSWVGSGSEESIKWIWFNAKEKVGNVEFLGYRSIKGKGNVIGLVQDNKVVDSISCNNKFCLIANQTPFYGESGGQMGDIGIITSERGLKINVLDTQKPLPDFQVHLCELQKGAIQINDVVDFSVDEIYRNALKCNHTSTHLLHWVLKKKLGSHIMQKGSLVAQDKLRFDFTHKKSISRSMLDDIEKEINLLICKNIPVKTEVMHYSDALKDGAIALFGEKYEDKVRVVSIEDKNANYSIELCGGTHVNQLGEIGIFKILQDTSIAAGIRRIEAVTSSEALKQFQNNYNLLKEISNNLQAKESEIIGKMNELSKGKKQLEKQLGETKKCNLLNILKKVKKQKVGEVEFISDYFRDVSINELRDLVQQYISSNSNACLLLFADVGGRLGIICAVSKELQSSIQANNLLDSIKEGFNAKGGGNKAIAQAVGDKKADFIKIAQNTIISQC